jgi:hypothetical protein
VPEKGKGTSIYRERIVLNQYRRDMSYYDNRTASYTVVFQVQLFSPDYVSAPNPNGNVSQADMANTRSTWLPMGNLGGIDPSSPTPVSGNAGVRGEIGSNFGGGSTSNRQFHHGDQFTAYDYDAYYLKSKYLYDPVTNPNGVLTIVSETL